MFKIQLVYNPPKIINKHIILILLFFIIKIKSINYPNKL